MNTKLSSLGARLVQGGKDYGLQIILLVGVWIYFSSSTPGFSGESAIFPVLDSFSLLGLVALGVGITMLIGELDLSIASIAGIGGAVAVRAGGTGLIGCLLIAAAAGALLGGLQGYLIGRTKISSLVFTVTTLILFRGLTFLLCDNGPLLLKQFDISEPLLERWGIFSPSILIAIALFILAWLFLSFTRLGREMYAIGGGRTEATAAGVSTVRSTTAAFLLSGALGALAGGIASIKGGSAAPENYAELLLTGVSAALIGGISLYGGRGTIANIALGVAIIGVITAGLVARGEQAYVTQLATGALLIIVIAMEYGVSRFNAARRRSGTATRGPVAAAPPPSSA